MTTPNRSPAGAVQALLEDQRRALAREIHDDIGGALGAAHFDLAWVARHPGHADAAAHVASAHEALRQAMAATQRVVHDLYPPDLSEGLVPALRTLARGFEKRFGLPVAFEVAPALDGPLPAPARLAVYRTLQESLANIARHAHAGAVAVSAGREGASMWLEVRDDGRGFDAGADAQRRPRDGEDPRGAGGFGLRGLAERAREAGGRLDVGSRPGRGTAVRLTLPVGAGVDADGGRDDEGDGDGDGDGARNVNVNGRRG
jgi:signal transduction histidine kinase